jgi:hypothetical protein
MTTTSPRSFVALLAVSAALFTGCGKNKSDPVTEAAKEDKQAGGSAPSIEEVKQIAQEGFIYGLPSSWATRRTI